jgi:hypothetical protein
MPAFYRRRRAFAFVPRLQTSGRYNLQWITLLRSCLRTQLQNELPNLPIQARAKAAKGDPGAPLATHSRDVPGNTHLHLARNKVHLHARAPFKVEIGRLNKAPGKAQVDDPALKEQCPMRNKDLSVSLAGITGMSPAIRAHRIDGWLPWQLPSRLRKYGKLVLH